MMSPAAAVSSTTYRCAARSCISVKYNFPQIDVFWLSVLSFQDVFFSTTNGFVF